MVYVKTAGILMNDLVNLKKNGFHLGMLEK